MEALRRVAGAAGRQGKEKADGVLALLETGPLLPAAPSPCLVPPLSVGPYHLSVRQEHTGVCRRKGVNIIVLRHP
jgi:hypothetical protein